MPPEPTQSEKQDKKSGKSRYISRCIAYVINNEGLSQKAAAGKCYGMWEQSKKRQKAKGNIEEPDFDKETDFGDFTFLP